MTFGPGRLVVLCGLIPTLVAALLSLYRPALLSNWESGTYDLLLRATPTRAPSGQIVIVDIDDRSLTTIGQWPWRRDVIGNLITRLRDLGAATVALDIIFAEPDRYDGVGVSPDAALAETLRGGRVVLGYAMTFEGGHTAPHTCELNALGLAIAQRGDSAAEPFFKATGAVCNLPVLTQAAPASGFLNAAPDPDGLLRRVPVLLEYNGRVYPSLALTAVMAVTGARDPRSASPTSTRRRWWSTRADSARWARATCYCAIAARSARSRTCQPPTCSRRPPRRHLQGQDRPRRHHRARHARSRVDAARHAVCRRRSASDRRRQPAAAATSSVGPHGRARKLWPCNAARHRPRSDLDDSGPSIRPRLGGRCVAAASGGRVGRSLSCCRRPACSSRRSFRRSA